MGAPPPFARGRRGTVAGLLDEIRQATAELRARSDAVSEASMRLGKLNEELERLVKRNEHAQKASPGDRQRNAG